MNCPHCNENLDFKLTHVCPQMNASDTPEQPAAPRCHSFRDGECVWDKCPQIRDGEPAKSGRHCPLDIDTEDDE